MGTALELDTARLRRLASGLDAVAQALSAGAAQATPADELGSFRLAAVLDEFSDGWRLRRSRLGSDVEALRTRVFDAADGFETADHVLARSLQGRHR